MKNFSTKNNIFLKLFIFIFIIFNYGAVAIYETKYCNNKNNLACTISNTSLLPTKWILNSLKGTKTLFSNYKATGKLNSSGLLANYQKETKKRFSYLEGGFNFYYPPNTRKEAGYLFFSKYPIKNKRIVELWDLNKQEKIKEYIFDLKNISKKIKNYNFDDKNLRLRSPKFLKNGSIIIPVTGSGGNILIKFDLCGKYLKHLHFNDLETHHSLEIDKDGYLYVPIYDQKKVFSIKNNFIKSNKYLSDGFAILDDELNILKKYFLTEIYLENNLIGSVFGDDQLAQDPYHLNDVQPITNKYNEKLALLSIRNHSRLMALNLSTKKIIWYIDNITLNQHDIDVLNNDDSDGINISIFDNNLIALEGYDWFNRISLGNRIVFLKNLPTFLNNENVSLVSPDEHSLYSPSFLNFSNFKKEVRPNTKTEGLAELIKENNSIMLENTNYGHMFEFETKNNKILWEFLNIDPTNKDLYILNWSSRFNKVPDSIKTDLRNKCPKILTLG